MASLCYRRHRFPPEIIQHAIWLYLRFTLVNGSGALRAVCDEPINITAKKPCNSAAQSRRGSCYSASGCFTG